MSTQTFTLVGTTLGPITLTVPVEDAAETQFCLEAIGFEATA